MTSIQTILSKVGKVLYDELGAIVYHYWRPVMVDYFTQTEYDPNIDKVQQALNSVCSNWILNSVQYEDDTKLIHYEWRFTVI